MTLSTLWARRKASQKPHTVVDTLCVCGHALKFHAREVQNTVVPISCALGCGCTSFLRDWMVA